MNSALLSSKKMDYCTPQGFFDTLNAEFHFTLDAAATEKSAKCKQFYTPETDGLTAPWNIGGGSVFCNPPYGRALGAWVRKAYEEAQAGTTVVLLIPARTDTAYFHDYISSKALPLTTAPSLRRRRSWNTLVSTSACPGLKCISATRIPLGSGAPTRTPTA